jgi:hypothetical protein
VNWRVFFLSVSVVAVLSLGASYFFGLTFGAAFAVILIAVLVNGWLATVEDDMPGGFNNPQRSDSDTSNRTCGNP